MDVEGPGIRVSAGAGDDRVLAEGQVDGGPGNDRLYWGGTVSGGTGNDSIKGSDGRDRIDGGSGHDAIAGSVTDSGRRDSLAGGSGNDYMAGRGKLSGGAGSDHIGGGGTLSGGSGDDTFGSGFGHKTGLSIESTRASIFGGRGRDTITGSDARDLIRPGPGEDTVLAEGGKDVVRSQDGSTDLIECSDGRDSARADGVDHVEPDCEGLKRRGAARAVATFAGVDEYLSSFGVIVECPRDGPRVCVAQVNFVIRGGVRRSYRLRIPRGRYRYPDFRIGRRAVSYYNTLGDPGRPRTVRVTVRSNDRAGIARVASRALDVEFEMSDYCPGGCD